MSYRPKGKPFKLNDKPWEQQHGETTPIYKIFQFWIAAEGKLNWTDLSIEFDVKPDTIKRYASAYKWTERLQRTKGLAAIPEHLTAPATDDPVAEIASQDKTLGIDPATLRAQGQEEVLAGSYAATTGLYRQLLAHAERAVLGIDTDNLSLGEVKHLISMVADLDKARIDQASQLLGIEELAKAIAQLRKRRK
ncbi:hypothetical protein OAL66_01725 [bacterium]|nr:hypothetical protein [bacterium]